MASIHDILRPITYTKTISVVSAASSWLLNYFGMQVGGPNEGFYGNGREFSYHVFNNMRTVALETGPGMPAARRGRQAVDKITGTFPRMHEEFPLLLEEIHNFAKIDDPKLRDIAGESYIQKQSIGPGQRHANWRATLLVGMLRDSLYLKEQGNYWYPTYSSSGAIIQRSFNLPAGNKSQLNMVDRSADGFSEGSSIYGADIIDKTWANPTANIPLHCRKISDALFRRHGLNLQTVMLGSQEWDYVINNDKVAAGHGIANKPFKEFTREVGTNADGSPKQLHYAQLLNVPGVDWIVNNDGRWTGPPGGEAFARDIEDNCALFLPEINSMTFEGLTGSEPMLKKPYGQIGEQEVVAGFSAWNYLLGNPSSIESFIVDNFIPVPYQNGNRCYGTVVF